MAWQNGECYLAMPCNNLAQFMTCAAPKIAFRKKKGLATPPDGAGFQQHRLLGFV